VGLPEKTEASTKGKKVLFINALSDLDAKSLRDAGKEANFNDVGT